MDEFLIESSKRVMAIFAHPDDAETAAGGTLSLMTSLGAEVSLLTIARGEKGRGESSNREKESLLAGEILGIKKIESLGYNDGEFNNDLELRALITEKVRCFAPDTVICPDPTAIFFSHAYVNHRDHRETGWAVLDVVSSAVNNPKYFATSKAHDVSHLLCAGTLEPNCYVDISKSLDNKIKAVLCHESQVASRQEQVISSIKDSSSALNKSHGVKSTEIFRYCSLSGSQGQL